MSAPRRTLRPKGLVAHLYRRTNCAPHVYLSYHPCCIYLQPFEYGDIELTLLCFLQDQMSSLYEDFLSSIVTLEKAIKKLYLLFNYFMDIRIFLGFGMLLLV